MKITRIGIDLAKQVFQLHGVDVNERVVLRRQLKRKEMVDFFKALSPCDIGMEACASAHHWARTLEVMGHRVKLIAPQFVKPYVKGNKNDANDAAAICEAMSRPDMRLPILFAMAYPDRPQYDAVRFSITDFATLTFRDPDPERYPALALGYRAAQAGGVAGAVLNAADEVAVESFLQGRIPFPDIARRVRDALDAHARTPAQGAPTIDDVLDADRRVREEASAC